MIFKVGDRIKCIDPDRTCGLTLNKIYTITRIDDDKHLKIIRDDGVLFGFSRTRFIACGYRNGELKYGGNL